MIFDYSEPMNNIQLDKSLSFLREIKNSNEDLSFYLLYHSKVDETVDEVDSHQQDENNTLYRITYADYKTTHTPTLLELHLTNGEHQQLLKQSVQVALSEINPDKLSQFKPRKIYGWLISSLSAPILAAQLGYIAIQSRDRHKELIRYFDPSILPLFMSLLNEAQRNKVLRPIVSWLYMDGDGQIKNILNSEKVTKHIMPELAISSEQWLMIDEIVVANQILIRYRKSHMALPRITEQQYVKWIWTLLRKAKIGGYKEQQDLIEYGYYSLIVHPDVMEHHRIIQLRQQLPNYRLKEMLSQLSTQEWEEIKNDLEEENNDKM